MEFALKFAERLKEFMDENSINSPTLAKKINTDRSNITRYRNGERMPDFNTLLAILDLFSCSADYLLGKTDYPPERKYGICTQPFSTRLRYVIKSYNITRYQLEKKFSKSSVQGWLSGSTFPSAVSLCELANYIGCSIDFLIGRID